MLVLHSDHTQIGLLRLKQTYFDFPFHFQLPDLKPDSCQADGPKEEWALTLTALSVVLCFQKCRFFFKKKCCQHLDINIKLVFFAQNTEKYSQIILNELCSLSKNGNLKAGHFGAKLDTNTAKAHWAMFIPNPNLLTREQKFWYSHIRGPTRRLVPIVFWSVIAPKWTRKVIIWPTMTKKGQFLARNPSV